MNLGHPSVAGEAEVTTDRFEQAMGSPTAWFLRAHVLAIVLLWWWGPTEFQLLMLTPLYAFAFTLYVGGGPTACLKKQLE